MNRAYKVATTMLVVYYAYMIEYRAEIFLWVLSGSLPFIFMGVWIKAAGQGGFELSSLEFARYFLAAFIVRQFNLVWIVWEFEEDVIQGKLSPRLLQPIDPVWYYVFLHLAERLARLPLLMLLIIFFFILYPEAYWIPSLSNVIVASIVVVLAFILRFLIQYTFAIFTFWIERATAIEQIWLLFYIFLSGMIAPLEVFPPTLREIVLWTPFPYMINFPASLLIGLPVDLFFGFSIIIIWIVIFWIVNRWLWRKGIKQYSGMGA